MRNPWVIAHRGASGHAPENTISSFERAVQLGAGFIETDLQLTRDGRFVAIHDSVVDRTTNGHGAVHDFTLAELKKLDTGRWFDRQFIGEQIPTLEEILDFARKHDVVFYLEVKYDSALGMHHALAAALQEAQNAARTIVISFDPGALASIQKLGPSIMLGLIVDEWLEGSVKLATEVGARQLCPRWDGVTKELVQAAHRADLRVATWTVNKAEEMKSAIDTGVDGIITDFPDRLRAVIEDRG
jgi:glycerophosphoryl diester phosphodiesterase